MSVNTLNIYEHRNHLLKLLRECVVEFYSLCDYAECDFDDTLISRIDKAGVHLPPRKVTRE